ncbi:AMP-dependent synthetase/ligase [Mycolicibacterium fluoranthenivorans]|uniref:Long-subunit acyl-CoA synthetase (AMP-forming) n=1 Tax=Mycolicibacterium fluoranthenivorans TaxID=258505 RepID=A0A7X5TZD4_9MYCO|nr:AMP-dependent synthetase/ligase [Mycolicibacterium fluoranthenivorans]MCV7358307.1 long-chain fatty acid--CoA ligase [Mycolicibacterium fluoranthenivorans]NIH95565.1 long-subunit acyl-CoA synthetase (AMP-forming) [Mycolicibacterium fluoranthenivorans]
MGVVSPLTLSAAFQATVERHPDRVALRTIDDSERYTWRDYADEVGRVARGLAALGVDRGDTVAMLLTNRPAFHIVDTAALHLGATAVSVYPTLPPEDIAWTINDSGAKVVVTELAKLDSIRAAGVSVPIVLVDGRETGVIPFGDLDGDHDVQRAWRAVAPDDVAVIVYTSGTTGTPKGVELTHAAVLGNTKGLHHAIGTVEGARVVSYLPMAHAAERQLSHYRAMVFGLEVTTCPDSRLMPEYLLAVRPHYFFAPPRMLAKFRAAAVGLDAPILEHFGLDQAVVALTGSAPVPAELTQFWLDAGLPLVEAWGVTECGAFGAFGRPGSYRVGTCGPALPGVELKVADDGEILLRSPWLMRGYRNQPDATAEAIDPDGWLHTGDVGEFDDGHLRIIDRKKEIIINAAGKNMSPAHIEARLKESDQLIGEAVVIGDNRPYNVALVVPDPAVASQLEGDLSRAIVEAMRRANARLARVEQIKRIEILNEPWLPGGDELTPTMKLKRRAIHGKYAVTIDQIYAGGGIGI